MPLTPPLFDRFSPDGHSGVDALAQDITALLGARRAYPGRMAGILNWGLPGTIGMTPHQANDRQHVAARITEALRQFAPLLDNIRVTPVADMAEFTFRIEATLAGSAEESMTLRIQSPRLGGALGADVALQNTSVKIAEFATLPDSAAGTEREP